jgi:Uma2 family endonuclease
MSIAETTIFYPESDGKPMAETDVHRDLMFYFILALQEFFRGREVYVSGNLFLYYLEGNPRRSVSPDCLVVIGIQPGQRRVYKTWVEGKVPDLVIEVTSKSTRDEDQVEKAELYASLGIREMWHVDPLGEYLGAPFRGFRLVEGNWIEIAATAGRAYSAVLDLDFYATAEGVRLALPGQDIVLPAPHELAANLRDAEEKLVDAGEQLRQRDAEIARLHAELERLRTQQSD